jgi:hypothetical protein
VACDHVGPQELIEMAEGELRRRGVAAEEWDGLKFRWSENTDGGFWASIVIEVERRSGNWTVTRLDRSAELQPQAETGLRQL